MMRVRQLVPARWRALSLLAVALPGSAFAQPPAMVQATPSAAAVERLNQNLSRLSRSPQDVQALLGAGQAALDLGDMQAANGFFTRANMVSPSSAQAKLGLAVVSLALKQPQEAATYFDAADALGDHAVGRLADRGLAYDLTGQQEKAQRDYQGALRANPGDAQARLRYAVSLGISGQVAAAQQQLEPALATGDREAWRCRAFILAMNGKQAEARKIAQTVMPKGLADALEPYMARVALLTPAQKAAAVHYGDFPSNVLRMAAPGPTPDAAPPKVLASAAKAEKPRKRRRGDDEDQPREIASAAPVRDDALTPPSYAMATPAAEPTTPSAAPPMAASSTPAPGFSGRQGSRIIPASPPPRREVARSSIAAPVPERQAILRPSSSSPAAVTPATPPGAAADDAALEAPVMLRREIATPLDAQPQQPADMAAPAYAQGPADPGGQGAGIAPAPPAQVASAMPAPVAAAPSPATPPRSLAALLAGMSVPEGERSATTPPVDLAAVARVQQERRKAQEKTAADKAKRDAAAKAKAEAAAKAKAEAEEKARLARNPSRIWVQVATGRDVAALAFDLRRMRRSYADVLGDQSGWTAEWGATQRLLVGPYASSAKAKDAVAAIKKSGGDAFIWMSEAGEEVEKIGGK